MGNHGNIIWNFGNGGGAAAPPAPPSFLTLLPYYRVELGHVWKDTAGTIPATADGDSVARLDDQSGGAMHLLQANALLQPLLKLNVQNGKPGLLFDGVNDVLPAGGTPTVGSAFVVAKNGSAAFPSYDGCFSDQSDPAVSDDFIMFTGNSGTNDWYSGDGRFSTPGTGLMYVDGAATYNLGTMTDAHATIGIVTGVITNAQLALQMGRDRTSGGRYWGGYIFEAGVTATAISAPNRALLQTYFQSYWATP